MTIPLELRRNERKRAERLDKMSWWGAILLWVFFAAVGWALLWALWRTVG